MVSKIKDESLDAFLNGETEHLQIDNFIFYKEGGRIIAGNIVFKDNENKLKNNEKYFDLKENVEIDIESKQIISINQLVEDLETGSTSYMRFDGLHVQERISRFNYDQFKKEFNKKYKPIIQVINKLNESYNPSSR